MVSPGINGANGNTSDFPISETSHESSQVSTSSLVDQKTNHLATTIIQHETGAEFQNVNNSTEADFGDFFSDHSVTVTSESETQEALLQENFQREGSIVQNQELIETDAQSITHTTQTQEQVSDVRTETEEGTVQTEETRVNVEHSAAQTEETKGHVEESYVQKREHSEDLSHVDETLKVVAEKSKTELQTHAMVIKGFRADGRIVLGRASGQENNFQALLAHVKQQNGENWKNVSIDENELRSLADELALNAGKGQIGLSEKLLQRYPHIKGAIILDELPPEWHNVDIDTIPIEQLNAKVYEVRAMNADEQKFLAQLVKNYVTCTVQLSIVQTLVQAQKNNVSDQKANRSEESDASTRTPTPQGRNRTESRGAHDKDKSIKDKNPSTIAHEINSIVAKKIIQANVEKREEIEERRKEDNKAEVIKKKNEKYDLDQENIRTDNVKSNRDIKNVQSKQIKSSIVKSDELRDAAIREKVKGPNGNGIAA